MEIQVGEYIRTDNGMIFKVLEVEKGSVKIKSDYREWIGICCIVKHSFNIIDLIEENDYVNGKRVVYVASIENKNDEEELCVFVEETQDCIEAQNIKSIVTKEVMKSVEYRVN